jgi:hypothetical protein
MSLDSVLNKISFKVQDVKFVIFDEAEFVESEHPRGPDGKFISGGQ